MTEKQNLLPRPINRNALAIHMIIGGLIALAIVIVFLSGGHPKAEWPKLWYIRPLVITPIAGALGGAVIYFMEYVSYGGSWGRILAIIFGVIVAIIGLWLGFVLGFDGTYWN